MFPGAALWTIDKDAGCRRCIRRHAQTRRTNRILMRRRVRLHLRNRSHIGECGSPRLPLTLIAQRRRNQKWPCDRRPTQSTLVLAMSRLRLLALAILPVSLRAVTLRRTRVTWSTIIQTRSSPVLLPHLVPRPNRPCSALRVWLHTHSHIPPPPPLRRAPSETQRSRLRRHRRQQDGMQRLTRIVFLRQTLRLSQQQKCHQRLQ